MISVVVLDVVIGCAGYPGLGDHWCARLVADPHRSSPTTDRSGPRATNSVCTARHRPLARDATNSVATARGVVRPTCSRRALSAQPETLRRAPRSEQCEPGLSPPSTLKASSWLGQRRRARVARADLNRNTARASVTNKALGGTAPSMARKPTCAACGTDIEPKFHLESEDPVLCVGCDAELGAEARMEAEHEAELEQRAWEVRR